MGYKFNVLITDVDSKEEYFSGEFLSEEVFYEKLSTKMKDIKINFLRETLRKEGINLFQITSPITIIVNKLRYVFCSTNMEDIEFNIATFIAYDDRQFNSYNKYATYQNSLLKYLIAKVSIYNIKGERCGFESYTELYNLIGNQNTAVIIAPTNRCVKSLNNLVNQAYTGEKPYEKDYYGIFPNQGTGCYAYNPHSKRYSKDLYMLREENN